MFRAPHRRHRSLATLLLPLLLLRAFMPAGLVLGHHGPELGDDGLTQTLAVLIDGAAVRGHAGASLATPEARAAASGAGGLDTVLPPSVPAIAGLIVLPAASPAWVHDDPASWQPYFDVVEKSPRAPPLSV
ncbi:MAG: hypothetical protein NTZ79_05990 [Proteobacteria bacterium]|nr:hypothetical protein [Pseudomonadota bacterium]